MKRGTGFLAIWSDVERANLTDYRHWLTREHTTERVTTEGFLASRVFRADLADIDRFFILYELETPEVLDGPAYLDVFNQRFGGWRLGRQDALELQQTRLDPTLLQVETRERNQFFPVELRFHAPPPISPELTLADSPKASLFEEGRG